jgi:hypothetical protein
VPNRGASAALRFALRHLALTLVAALVAAGPLEATSQALYKWTDKDGKVQYSDKPPAKFEGEVTRIEIDTQPTTRPPYVPPQAQPKAVETGPPQPADPATKRRELRAKLEAGLAAARAQLAAAKAALEASDSPQEGDGQVVQQRFAKPKAGRSNCRAVKGADNKVSFNCPALVPNDAYYERIKNLEDAVARAEEELAAAEGAYRRGVD